MSKLSAMNPSKLSEAHLRKKKRFFWLKITTAGSGIVLTSIALFGFIFWVKAAIVEVAPDEAAVQAQRVLTGLGWVQQDKVYLLGNQADLKVSAPGFISEIVTLNRSTLERRIMITLKEAPAVIKATAVPADITVQWQLNAQLIASESQLQTSVEPGEYELTASHPYYQPQTVSMTLERAEEKIITFNLEPVQGRLDVSSNPANVPILLDNEPIGKTPISLSKTGGTYRVQIETPDFEAIDDLLEITNQQPIVSRNYRLQYKRAYVNFALSPPGGQLMIDGKLIPIENMPIALEPMRELTISYSKTSYFSQTIKRTLKPNQKETIDFSLDIELGKVVINATPQAFVKIDNIEKGETPQSLTLDSRAYMIELYKPGYRTIQKTIYPSSKRVIEINETLMTELQARLADSPPVMTNSIGVELVLFNPSKAQMPFQIGAHRSEKGQRANEIIRNVSLSRVFYISRTEISAKHYHAFDSQVQASDLPVSNLRWDQAAKFCNWLSVQEKLSPFYASNGNVIIGYNSDSDGYRLPSEAEWEWLARYAGRQSSVQFVWGKGNTIPKNIGNLADESAKNSVQTYIPNYNDGYVQLAAVGSFKQDAAGLYDLAGNVREWVHDAYSIDITTNVMNDPLGPLRNNSQSMHVVKGSSWKSGTLSELRSAYRQKANNPADDIGFRIARYVY